MEILPQVIVLLVLGNYNPRSPNYFINQSIYGLDYTRSLNDLNYGISLLSTENENNSNEHLLTNLRFEKFYNKGEMYFSFAHKESEINTQKK